MPTRLTVFYSWQSDSPSKLNRNFIEKALKAALDRLHSDAVLELSPRDFVVELDKDTMGVGGSPPIAETIFRKIDECAVFVADLTFVGKSLDALTDVTKTPRLFPNPNVLIEYGYARKRHGTNALVGVMNTAYGELKDLPFDLRHLRGPITYHLADSADGGKATQFDNLTSALVAHLRLILEKHQSSPPASAAPFTPANSKGNPAAFWDKNEALVAKNRWTERIEAPAVPDEGRAYLRLYPTVVVPPLGTELDAERLLHEGGMLRPMGEVRGWNVSRNVYGGIMHEAPVDGRLSHFSQLFLSREIWGVDAQCLNKSELRELTKLNGYIPSGPLEEVFAEALPCYLTFAKSILQLPLPLHLEAGLVGIKGYPITVGENVRGECFHDHVVWRGEVPSHDRPAYDILVPFFELVHKKCGVERPPSRQVALVQRFAGRV